MKLFCKVEGKPALVVGYAQGRKQKVLAIVICEGELRSFRLSEIQLQNVPEGLDKPKTELKVVKS